MIFRVTLEEIGEGKAVLLGEGDTVKVQAQSNPFRFLLIAGEPLNEEVAWNGPIVMNTQDELKLAFQEYREGRFIKI